jgi:pimeloyl-ACP methyl ester carboxylesterase
MLPGLDGTGRLFAAAANLAWDGMTAIPFRLPNRGPQDYETLARHLVPRLPDGGWVVVAESFSTPLAMRLAASQPGRVRALVLVAGFCTAPQAPGLGWLPLRPLFALTPPAFFLRKFLLGSDAPQPLVDELAHVLRKVPAGTLVDRLRVALALRAKDCPAVRGIPTLLLQARHDAVIPWEAQSQLERHLPEAAVEWIDGPHLLLQTCPSACRDAILAFLAGRLAG